jgi:hypothetical protein
MRFAPAFKYQLSANKWPLIVYYIVIYALMAIILMVRAFATQSSFTMFGGLDGATAIFLFVVGLNSFKSKFHMFVANGISRKTMFLSFIASAAVICVGMAVIDSINAFILSQFVNYQSTILQQFSLHFAGRLSAVHTEGFLLMCFANMAAIMLGYFITTAYYRMNKPLKLLVSIGVPLMLLFILPMLDSLLFNHWLANTAAAIAAFCSGQSTGSPFVQMACHAVSIVIYAGLAYLLARRATVKLQPA